MDATSPPRRTTFARPIAATARSPNILIRTMNALTATSPSAPVDASTAATSVTWTDDQSTAVPSARPKLNAIAPSNTANAGTRGPASGPLTVLIPAVIGTHREIPTQATTETALSVTRAGAMTAPPSPASRAMRTTADAPARFPTLKPACSRLITGFTRACSTRTPRAFIETSMAPLPRPANAAAAAASGRLRANARAATPAINSAAAGSTTLLAPRLSARRPPICMDTRAAAASETSTTASPPASTPSRSRIAGNVAPIPPTRVPFTAKRPATATRDFVPARFPATSASASGAMGASVTARLSQSRRDSPTTLDAALCSPVVRAAPPVTSGFTNAYAGGVLLGDGRQAFLKASGPEFPFPVLSLGRPLATDTDALGAGAQNDHLIHFDLRPDNLLVGRRAGEVADRAYVREWNWVTLGPAWCDWVSVIPAMQAQGHDLGELMDLSLIHISEPTRPY